MAEVLTDIGTGWVASKLNEAIQTTADYVGWGTGVGIADKIDTALFAESTEARVLATRSQPDSNTVQWVALLTANSNKIITNAGNFTTSTGGDLICHANWTGVPLETGDKIEITIQLTIL